MHSIFTLRPQGSFAAAKNVLRPFQFSKSPQRDRLRVVFLLGLKSSSLPRPSERTGKSSPSRQLMIFTERHATGSDLFALSNAAEHFSSCTPATGPLALSLSRVPERLSALAAPYSPSDRLALVKSDWSVGTGQRSSTWRKSADRLTRVTLDKVRSANAFHAEPETNR
jgi:hypothetical protein